MKIFSLTLWSFVLLSSCTSFREKSSNSVLDQILMSKKLIVGTTGDYAPFSFKGVKGEQYLGIDIDLAKHLARSLGVQLQFYPTTWKSLMADLKANRFHVAMSGISKKLSRQQVGLFSKGYIDNGKMAIARCLEKNKFDTLKKIDRAHVNVIVNPGGTNEKFVNEHLKRASVRVFANNNLIFKEIIEHRADVMITDSVEVAFQTKKHQGRLCPTMKTALTMGEIAILLPRDMIWKEYVASWLHQIEKNGEKKRIFHKYIHY